MARVIAAAFIGVAADTVSICGLDSDHFVVYNINTDADATGGPRKGKPFTITIEGIFDEAHQHGRVVGDLHLKALGIVDQPVTFDQTYDFLPGFAEDMTKIVIGPFTFPRAVPGEVKVTGRINVVNEKAEAVTCLDLNLIIPKIVEEEEQEEKPLETSRNDCGDQSHDHITNIQSEIIDDVATITMDLDEDLDFFNLKVDLNVKAPLVPAVDLKLTHVPISVTPGFPAGQLKFVGYPQPFQTPPPNDIVDVIGSLKLEDKNGEEIRCIGFGADSSAITV
jgi:hypothetical protein